MISSSHLDDFLGERLGDLLEEVWRIVLVFFDAVDNLVSQVKEETASVVLRPAADRP